MIPRFPSIFGPYENGERLSVRLRLKFQTRLLIRVRLMVRRYVREALSPYPRVGSANPKGWMFRNSGAGN